MEQFKNTFKKPTNELPRKETIPKPQKQQQRMKNPDSRPIEQIKATPQETSQG